MILSTMILVSAVRILFAAMFAFTGIAKLVRGPETETVLVKLIGLDVFARLRTDSRTAVRALAAYEISLAAVVAAGWQPARWLLLATMVLFCGVVVRAWWLHVDCGCFPDRRPSEVASIARTSLLTGLASILAVEGIHGVRTTGQWLLASLLAAVLAAGVYLAYASVRTLAGSRTAIRSPGPTMVHEIIAGQISHWHGGRDVPLGHGNADGWLTADRAARLSGLPVSVILTELSHSARPDGSALLAIGSRPQFAVVTTSGKPVTSTDLGDRRLLALFSSTCKRCPAHVEPVARAIQRSGCPPALVVVAGPPDLASRFVEAFAPHADVALIGFEDQFIDEFAIFEFPAFYVLAADGAVTAAARDVADLPLSVP